MSTVKIPTAEPRVQSQGSRHGICGRQNGIETSFSYK